MKLATKFNLAFDRIINAANSGASVLTAFIALGICLHVLMRYFLKFPIRGLLEITEFTLLWIPLLAGAWLLREQKHIRMDLVVNLLKPKTRALINAITSMVAAIVYLVVFWYSTLTTAEWFVRGVVTPTAVMYLEAPILLIIPVSSLLLFIQLLRTTHVHLREWKLAHRSSEDFHNDS